MRKRMLRALARALDRQVYECLALEWPHESRLDSGPCATRVEVRAIERGELARLSIDPACEISANFLRGIEHSSDLCFGAFAGDALVSYVFFAPASPTAIDAQLRFQFPPGWVYVYKAFTVPAWRGRRLISKVLMDSMPHLGMRRFVTLVVSGNRASKKAFERCGFRQVQRFPVWRVLSRPWPAAAPRSYGFSIDSAGLETMVAHLAERR